MIKVLLADDHNLVREGLRTLIDRLPDTTVVGQAVDGEETVSLAIDRNADILLVDVVMPKLTGLQVIKQLRSRHAPLKIIVLSMYAAPELVKQAFDAGANGYLLKQSIGAELPAAIKSVWRNEAYLSPALGITLAELADMDSPPPLSAREQEVLRCIAAGNTTVEIAQTLYLSHKTVEKHRASLMFKLKARNVAELIRVAIERGLIFPKD